MCVDRCVIGTNQRKNQVGHYSSQTGTESTQPVYITHHFKARELSTGFVACSVTSAYEKNFMNQLISRHFYDNINDNKQQVFHWDNRCKEWILFLPYKWPVLTQSVKSRPLCFPDYFISFLVDEIGIPFSSLRISPDFHRKSAPLEHRASMSSCLRILSFPVFIVRLLRMSPKTKWIIQLCSQLLWCLRAPVGPGLSLHACYVDEQLSADAKWMPNSSSSNSRKLAAERVTTAKPVSPADTYPRLQSWGR